MKTKVTINRAQKLYVMHESYGYSCIGFQVCARRAAALAAEMGQPVPTARPGSLKLYREFEALQVLASARNKATGWRSQSELTPELIGHEGKRVEVRHQYPGGPVEVSRFIVGKSTGFIPCHLEIKRRDSTGGGAVCLGNVLSVRRV